VCVCVCARVKLACLNKYFLNNFKTLIFSIKLLHIMFEPDG